MVTKKETNRRGTAITGIFLCSIAALAIYGCAGNPSIENLTSEQRMKLAEMKFVTSSELRKDSYEVIGPVQGLSCRRDAYSDIQPSEWEARQGLARRAASLNADAVLNAACELNRVADFGRNCWQTDICYGDAIRFKGQAP
jgi:uncharacterized protein YbjQ (UPF0145 family)